MSYFAGDGPGLLGKNIIEDRDADLLDQLPDSAPGESKTVDISDSQLQPLPYQKIGILGAGIGGLYAALILDSLDIDYEILEASERTGGRLQTYKFPTGGKYDYYEAGAMRFPFPKKDADGRYKNGIMTRLANLTEYGPLNEGEDKLRDKVIRYHFTDVAKRAFYYFNGVLQQVSQPKGDFKAEEMNVEADYIKAGADAINQDVIKPFVRMLIDDLKTGGKKGWKVLKSNDSYSVRAYMASKYLPSDSLNLPPQHLPNNVINWCGLLETSSGGFERSLTEGVLLSMAFAKVDNNTDFGDVEWKCFEGGSETLSKKLAEYIKKRKSNAIQFENNVTAISQGKVVISLPAGSALPRGAEDASSEPADLVVDKDRVAAEEPSRKRVKVPCLAVTVKGTETKLYSHVISTLPLPVLRTVDLNDAGLNVMQRNALRALDYGPAVKVAILFETNWWTTKLGIIGGQSTTDLPIRSVVYPTYGVDVGEPSKVLIASYSWTSDADRLGALAPGNEWATIRQLILNYAWKDEEDLTLLQLATKNKWGALGKLVVRYPWPTGIARHRALTVVNRRAALRELVLRNLAEAHGKLSDEITFDYLNDQFVDMHVKDWNRDIYTMGAFGHFSPGDFQDLYSALNVPAAGKRLHFAGEGVSIRHQWVVGALDSSWKAIYAYLKITGQTEKIKKFKETWDLSSEWATKSSLVDAARGRADKPDLIDETIGLVDHAADAGVILPAN